MDAIDLASRLPPALANRLRTWAHGAPWARRMLDPLLRGSRKRPITVRRGPAAGLRLDLAGNPVGTALGLNEPEVLAAFHEHLRPGDIVFDVGANVGLFSLVGARGVGATGRVFAFEPAPATAAVLRRNLERNGANNVTVLEIAASATTGRAHLQLHADSPLARLDTSGPLAEVSGRVEVSVVALDELVRDGSLPPPSFVKMDIEGAEIDALEGLRGTLRAHHPTVLVETHGTREAVEALLREEGYAVSGIESDRPETPQHVIGKAAF